MKIARLLIVALLLAGGAGAAVHLRNTSSNTPGTSQTANAGPNDQHDICPLQICQKGGKESWPTVSAGAILGTTWTVQIQSDGTTTCLQVQMANTAGESNAHNCFDAKEGLRTTGDLARSSIGVLDERGGLLGMLAVAVAGPSVESLAFSVKESEQTFPAVAGQRIDLPGGAVRVFIDQLDVPMGTHLSAVASGLNGIAEGAAWDAQIRAS